MDRFYLPLFRMEMTCDVLIVGAGPSGVSCGMHLKDSGLKVVVIDKSTFPRDKICGDAIPGPSWKSIKKFIPDVEKDIDGIEGAQKIKSSVINYQKKDLLSIFWATKAYNIPRNTFDNYLFQKLKNDESITVFEGDRINDIQRTDEGFILETTKGVKISSKFIVGADGANSVVRRKLGKEMKNDNTLGVSVRAYYKGLEFPSDANYFYIRNNFPGYFWVFPLENDLFNVGIGYEKELVGREMNIKESLQDFIDSDMDLKEKFSAGELVSKIVGHKLPYGGAKQDYSGDGFLLIGDAANLVDPMMGHGIDKALISGDIAAKHIIEAFKQNNFSHSFNKQYDTVVIKKLQKDLKTSLTAKKLFMNRLWLLKLVVPFAKLFSSRCK